MKELPILQIDPLLRPYQGDLALRMENYRTRLAALLPDGQDLAAFADGAAYFGFHRQADGWWYREWAPGADAMYLTGDFNGWDRRACPMTHRAGGVFDVFLPGRDALRHGQRVLAIVQKKRTGPGPHSPLCPLCRPGAGDRSLERRHLRAACAIPVARRGLPPAEGPLYLRMPYRHGPGKAGHRHL